MPKNKGIRFGIFSKVLLTMIFVSVAPLVTIWYVNYESTKSRIDSEVSARFAASANHLTNHVDSWVDMNRRMLLENARIPQIISMDAERQDQILALMTEIYDWNYLAFTVDLDGQNVGRSDGKARKYYGDRIYVQQVLDGSAMGKQVLIGKTSGKPAFVLSVPINSGEGKLKGVLAIAMTISEVSERITSTRLGRTGFAFLVDEEGKVIAHPSDELTNARQDLSADPAVNAAIEQGARSLVFQDGDGRKVIARMQRTEDDWILVVRQDFDEAFEAVTRSNRDAVFLLIATLVIVLIVSFIFSRRLSVPVLRLTDAAEAMSRGKTDVVVDEVNRHDEIGLLANAVVRLGTSIRLAMDRLNRRAKK